MRKAAESFTVEIRRVVVVPGGGEPYTNRHGVTRRKVRWDTVGSETFVLSKSSRDQWDKVLCDGISWEMEDMEHNRCQLYVDGKEVSYLHFRFCNHCDNVYISERQSQHCSDQCKQRKHAKQQAAQRKAQRHAARKPIICEQCGKSFTPKRSDARFCCTKCRVYHNRGIKRASKQPKAKASNRNGKVRYLYCAIRNPEFEFGEATRLYVETRRYRVIKEQKTQVKVDPAYQVRIDGNWVNGESDGHHVVYMTKMADGRIHYFHAADIFKTKPDSHWPGGPPKPEPESSWDRINREFEEQNRQWEELFSRLNPGRKARAAALAYFGLDKNADADAVQNAYRKLARKLHPDAGGNADDFKTLQHHLAVITEA